MQIVDQSPDTFVRRQLAHAVSSRHNLSVEEEAKILYDATIRGLADVAAGRKLPSEVVTTECSVDLNEAYFESPHDPREIQADEFVGLLMGLRDAEAGRTVPDDVVSAQFADYSRRLSDTL
ncbi:MAG: hypothetical protein P4M06_21660 [Pandoraea sp.]|nr:hypothetical protein [Pandoraea sp.]MDR3400158.1 hypothetical protein [Pandoraea sp.]